MNPLKFAINSYITKSQPISLVHFVTNRCNARCKHCFIDFDHPDAFKGELTLEEIETLTKNLGSNLFNVNITGGEPFLRTDLFEIVKAYFTNTTIESVFITTNGRFTQRTQEFIEKFLAAGIKGKIFFSISIDNFEEEHNKNRRSIDLFKHALNTYHMVTSYNQPNIMCNIAITVTDHNYTKVLELYDYLKSIGVSSFTCIIMREEGVIKKIDPKMKEGILDQYTKLAQKIHEDQLNGITQGWGSTVQGTLMNAKNMIINNTLSKTYIPNQYISHCPAGALFGVIYANGDVYPCEILYERKLGNLRDYNMNFMELWKNKTTHECKNFIKDIKCRCSYECAWSINVVSNPQYIPTLIAKGIKLKMKQKEFKGPQPTSQVIEPKEVADEPLEESPAPEEVLIQITNAPEQEQMQEN